MEYLLAALVGWCGTVPIIIRIPIPWPPRPEPEPICPVCAPILGAILGAVVFGLFREQFGDGLLELAVLSFAGGMFGGSLYMVGARLFSKPAVSAERPGVG